MAFAKYVETMIVENEEETCEIQLPIKKIDNIPVDCFLTLNIDSLETELKVFYKYYGTCEKSWQESMFNSFLEPAEGESFVTKEGTINFPEEFCEKVKDVTRLKFDHYNGFLTMGEIEDPGVLKDMFACENVVLNFSECVVCYRETKTTTKCGHHLCLECWGKLPPSCDCCKTGRTCPTCRNTRIDHCKVVCEECN